MPALARALLRYDAVAFGFRESWRPALCSGLGTRMFSLIAAKGMEPPRHIHCRSGSCTNQFSAIRYSGRPSERHGNVESLVRDIPPILDPCSKASCGVNLGPCQASVNTRRNIGTVLARVTSRSKAVLLRHPAACFLQPVWGLGCTGDTREPSMTKCI